MLMVLDGWGVREPSEDNAISLANTSNIDKLCKNYTCGKISASGEDVGLPTGQMGNSEVGHLNLGAGRIVYQDLTRISLSISDESFFENPAINRAMDIVREKDAALHLMGLVSDGGVHSHNSHLYALLKLAKKKGLHKVYVHAFLDGRDVPPRSASKYVKELEDEINIIGIGKIATISGRYYAMDRDRRWERTKLAYDAIVHGSGARTRLPVKAITKGYEKDLTDEFVIPTVAVDAQDRPITTVTSDDSVIFFNFRSDRPRQLTQPFVLKDFDGFDRGADAPTPFFVTMTEYDPNLKANVAFPVIDINNTLADVLADNGKKQLHIAETEKYAHVTFFFNGGVEDPKNGEERILVPSPKVATYDLKPSMSAYEVTDEVIKAIESDKFDFIILNFANADMVGHTGIIKAAVEAVEAVDDCVGKIADKLIEVGGGCIILGDHGNAEQMFGAKDKPHTAHTANPVKCIFVVDHDRFKADGRLSDIAPTILDLMHIQAPEEMKGESLLIKSAEG